jgi:hypothetical protein
VLEQPRVNDLEFPATCHWTSTAVIRAWDGFYRSWYGLNAPQARVGPVLLLEVRRSYRTVRLSDGDTVARGEHFGMLHLNNDALARLHRMNAGPVAIGLEFRRQLLESLHVLAALAEPGGPVAGVNAFAAITIMHRGLARLGFERDRRQLTWPGVTGAYQRALLASLHPLGGRRLLRLAHCGAERLWISRTKLRALYGMPARAAG